ncbi:MAG: HypC/HybG/HupF family hydrogenase formation chaperone [Eubacterium sp.]|nr:HypC/HybG/HupF family hydrogenase formation chaperone [Eubacterium sp.]
MCVALPGKVVELKGDTAVVDFSGNRVNARSGLVQVVPGDYVLVHAGCILQKVNSGEAEAIRELFEELEAFS